MFLPIFTYRDDDMKKLISGEPCPMDASFRAAASPLSFLLWTGSILRV
jgi:hypothetical protein